MSKQNYVSVHLYLHVALLQLGLRPAMSEDGLAAVVDARPDGLLRVGVGGDARRSGGAAAAGSGGRGGREAGVGVRAPLLYLTAAWDL